MKEVSDNEGGENASPLHANPFAPEAGTQPVITPIKAPTLVPDQSLAPREGWKFDVENRALLKTLYADATSSIEEVENIDIEINKGLHRLDVLDSKLLSEGYTILAEDTIEQNKIAAKLRLGIGAIVDATQILANLSTKMKVYTDTLAQVYPDMQAKRPIGSALGSLLPFTDNDKKLYNNLLTAQEDIDSLKKESEVLITRVQEKIGLQSREKDYTVDTEGGNTLMVPAVHHAIPVDVPDELVKPVDKNKDAVERGEYTKMVSILEDFASSNAQADALATALTKQLGEHAGELGGIDAETLMEDAKIALQHIQQGKSLLTLPATDDGRQNAFTLFGTMLTLADFTQVPRGLQGIASELKIPEKLPTGLTIGTYLAIIGSVSLSYMSFQVTGASVANILAGAYDGDVRAYESDLQKQIATWKAGGEKGLKPGDGDKLQWLKIDGVDALGIEERNLVDSIILELKVLGYGSSIVSLFVIMWLRAKEEKGKAEIVVMLLAMGFSTVAALSFVAVLLADAYIASDMGGQVKEDFGPLNKGFTDLDESLKKVSGNVKIAVTESVDKEAETGVGPNTLTTYCALQGSSDKKAWDAIWKRWDAWLATPGKESSKENRKELLEKKLMKVLKAQISDKYKHLFDGGVKAQSILNAYNTIEKKGRKPGELIKIIRKEGMFGMLDALTLRIKQIDVAGPKRVYDTLIKLADNAKNVNMISAAGSATLPPFIAEVVIPDYNGVDPITTLMGRGMHNLVAQITHVSQEYNSLRGAELADILTYMSEIPSLTPVAVPKGRKAAEKARTKNRERKQSINNLRTSLKGAMPALAVDSASAKKAMANVSVKPFNNGWEVISTRRGIDAALGTLGIKLSDDITSQELVQILVSPTLVSLGIMYLDQLPGAFFTGKWIFGTGPVLGGNNNTRRRRLERAFEQGKEDMHTSERALAKPIAEQLQQRMVPMLLLQGHPMAQVLESMPISAMEAYVIRMMRQKVASKIEAARGTSGKEPVMRFVNGITGPIAATIKGLSGVGDVGMETERELYTAYRTYLTDTQKKIKGIGKVSGSADKMSKDTFMQELTQDLLGSSELLRVTREISTVIMDKKAEGASKVPDLQAIESAQVDDIQTLLDGLRDTIKIQQVKTEILLAGTEDSTDENVLSSGIVIDEASLPLQATDYAQALKTGALREYAEQGQTALDAIMALSSDTGNKGELTNAGLEVLIEHLELGEVDESIASDSMQALRDGVEYRHTYAESREYADAFNERIAYIGKVLQEKSVKNFTQELPWSILSQGALQLTVKTPTSGMGDVTFAVQVMSDDGQIIAHAEYLSETPLVSLTEGGDFVQKAEDNIETLNGWLKSDAQETLHADYLIRSMRKTVGAFTQDDAARLPVHVYTPEDEFSKRSAVDLETILPETNITRLALDVALAEDMEVLAQKALLREGVWTADDKPLLEDIQRRLGIRTAIVNDKDITDDVVVLYGSAVPHVTKRVETLRSALQTIMQDASIDLPEGLKIDIGVFSLVEGAHPRLSVRLTHKGKQVLIPYSIREQTENMVSHIAKEIEKINQ